MGHGSASGRSYDQKWVRQELSSAECRMLGVVDDDVPIVPRLDPSSGLTRAGQRDVPVLPRMYRSAGTV